MGRPSAPTLDYSGTSEALRPLPATGPGHSMMGYPWNRPFASSSAAIGCPWLPLAAHGCPWLPLAALGCPWLPLAVLGYPRLPIAALGCSWLQLGCPWLPLAALGCPWLPLAALGYPWLPAAAQGCPWLPLAALSCPWLPSAALGLSKTYFTNNGGFCCPHGYTWPPFTTHEWGSLPRHQGGCDGVHRRTD